ncbi:MAG TPA: acetyl-CoA C-acetyltransferase [Candidatus Acidoferrum sp.]|jgi:acetyl-CoA C-acetyltransferase|nr:acetyl-CoA C-acetyltransferase [Candidatus Acidoferrum sp.]
METPVILSAVRTPVGKFQGGLSSFSAVELGSKVVAEAIRRADLAPKQIDEAILGNVVQAGLGQNPARQAALKGGCDPRVAALTINKVCGSGLKAVALAAQAVQLGESEIVLAGGMESMSNCPYLLPQARTGYRIGDGKLIDSMIHDGLWDAYEDFHMGMTGELVAEKYSISREEQDRFAFESHQKAVRARKSCFFEAQILPMEVPQKKGPPIVIKYDESPREDTSMEALAKLKPAFKKDGTVTAGNAPGTNDGAAALIVTSERHAQSLGKKPVARIVAQAVSGVEPKWVMMAPVDAVEKLLRKTGWDRNKDVDLIELNEAFAVAAIAVTRQLRLDSEKVNVNGGAVAIGHPIGASGARILVTLLYELQRRNLRRGIAALCLGGGNAVAVALEMM